MLTLTPRDYQQSIFETAKQANTLVVLPTGLGKTLIALMLSIHRLKQFPTTKTLVLAPTRPLVEQHLNTFKENLPDLFAEIHIFTGSVPAEQRKILWETGEIIFSTPQCIANDVSNNLYNLNEVTLLVIDEAHRCLKNYDYNKVSQFYHSQSLNPLVLGLTASPGSDYDKVKQICLNLNIQEIEIRSRSSPDVKPHVKELEFEKIQVDFPKEFIEIHVLLKSLYNRYISRLRESDLLFAPANKITLLKLQSNLAMQASRGSGAAMYGMSLCAQAIKLSHALELLETQTLSGTKAYLQSLVEQAEQKKTRGVQTLVKTPEFQASILSVNQLLEKNEEHPKIQAIKSLVESEITQNPQAKMMIFTQFRETAHLIVKTLKEIPNIIPNVFIGQSSKKNSQGLSQKEQGQIIEKFRNNEINVLVATSIGEEGLDIPEVSSVIFYEPIPSAIRKIQRTGRTARHSAGKMIMLITKETRDEINHYASSARERKMYKTIEKVKYDLKTESKNKTLKDFK